ASPPEPALVPSMPLMPPALAPEEPLSASEPSSPVPELELSPPPSLESFSVTWSAARRPLSASAGVPCTLLQHCLCLNPCLRGQIEMLTSVHLKVEAADVCRNAGTLCHARNFSAH